MIKKETLKKSLEFFENNPECDVLGCKLLLGDDSFQPSAGFLPTPFSVFNWILGIDLVPFISNFLPQFHPKNKGFFESDRQVGWIMGAFLFARKKVFDTVGGFDDNYFMYTEEVELCQRINDNGFKVWYTPTFSVTHLDKTSSKSDPEKLRRIAKNEILGVVYFLKKHYPNSIGLVLIFIKLGLLLRIIVFFCLGKKDRMNTYLETLEEI